jgi:hypothetical protein
MNSISVMQNLTTAWIKRLLHSRNVLPNLPNSANLQAYLPASVAAIHTSSSLDASLSNHKGPKKWLKYNEKVYPPQAPEEERRPAVSKPATQNIFQLVPCTYYINRYLADDYWLLGCDTL